MARKPTTWLRPNRRALLVGAVAPLLLLILGLAVTLNLFTDAPIAGRIVAAILAILGACLLGLLGWYARQPRLACNGEHLLVYLQSRGPAAIPIEFVECFFLGSGLRRLSGGREVQVTQLEVRLAERATEWAQVDVNPALGKWCGGYITIYGAWCEPLHLELVNWLNAQLAAAQENCLIR